MTQHIYTVHAYRFGDRGRHSYSVGVYPKKHAAIECAESEMDWRGGKYYCEVLKWSIGDKNEDGSPGMPSKVVLGLPK